MEDLEKKFDVYNNDLSAEKGDLLLEKTMLNDFFRAKGYDCLDPISIENSKNDTVFITASVQTALQLYESDKSLDKNPLFVAQPVIRTQFRDSIAEGSSVAFVNIATIRINGSQNEHDRMVSDWIELIDWLGLDISKITTREKEYERTWGDKLVCGHKVFYSYDGLELGDSAYLKLNDSESEGPITVSDIGFGLERLRWVARGASYYDLQDKDSSALEPETRCYCSTLALLAINKISPSHRGAGYRFRQFSKKLIEKQGISCDEVYQEILNWIDYWGSWSKGAENKELAYDNIIKENQRNINRLVLDTLAKNGMSIGQGIDINLPQKEFMSRLESTGLGDEIAKVLYN